MLKKKIISIAIAFSLILTMYVGLEPVSFATDLTSDFVVNEIEITHDDGSAITPTKPLKNGDTIAASITGAFDRKDIYAGDTMLIPIVANSPVRLSLASATPWVDLSYGSEGVIGRFRVNKDAELEIEITKDTNNVTNLSFDLGNTIKVSKIPVQSGVQTGTISALNANKTVYYLNTANVGTEYGVDFRKASVNKGSDFVRWSLLTNTKNLRRLYKKEPIVHYKNVYLEDEFSGDSEVVINDIKAMVYCPYDLTEPEPWEMGNRSYGIEIPVSSYTKISQNPGESYAELKARLGAFEYAIYEDTTNSKNKFVINLGQLDENTPFTLDSLKPGWANSAASSWINKQYFDESDRAAIVARLVEVFGNNNQVNGHAIAFNVKLTESFDPVLYDVVKTNTAEMNAVIDPDTPFNASDSDSTTIAGLNGSIDLEPDEVALLKVDKNNTPIKGVEIELQKRDGANWTTVGSSKFTEADGKAVFSGLSINDNDHFRFVELNAPIPYDKDSVVFKTLDGNLVPDGEFDHFNEPVLIVATNDVLKRDVEVEKVWNDDNNPSRPTSVSITLVKDGVDTSDTLLLNDTNNWKDKFENLPQYDGQNEITYTIKEDSTAANDGYSVEVTGDQESGFIVTNTKLPETYKLGDYVWYDTNKDGQQDMVEAGVEGVTVTLTKPDGTTETTTTDENGYYEFDNLPNGVYSVEFTNLPEGYVPTISNVGTNDEADSDGLNPSGEIRDNNNFSLDLGIHLQPTYKLGDYVWYDTNKDGQQDMVEAGVEGVTVTLTKPDGTTETTTTDEDGYYEFDNLPNGVYSVEFTNLPEGYVPTTSNVGTNDSADSDGLNPSGEIRDAHNFTLDLGIVKEEVEEPTYKLGDYVWVDENYDGIQDENEVGVQGVTVTLTKPDGTTETTTTDENGYYEFTDLPNGDYEIAFTNLPEGFVPTKTNEGGDDSRDSDGLTTTGTIADADNMTLDLGIIQKDKMPGYNNGDFKIGDYVWYDLDGDGIQDSNEGGVENVTVTLTAPDGEKFVTTTDATGHYVFNNMRNGEYKIEFTNLPEGYKSTLKNKGSDDSKDSDGLVTTGVIENADNMTLDLGVVEKAALPKTGSGSSRTLYMIIGLILIVGGILYFWKGKKSSK